MKILVTGAAGFIGYHLSQRLLKSGYAIVGLDNLNDYYDVTLKEARLAALNAEPHFTFKKMDLVDQTQLLQLFSDYRFDVVVNLAAQAGVRYSITHPDSYIKSNLVGFSSLLEACRHHQVKHLIFASSSSVYGANTIYPFAEEHNVDHPVSLYAATKKSNELMAHCYAHLYGLRCTGLRFFTVYGPWGRPDMACFKFTKSILAGTPIDVFNHGDMHRDFTYIDDIIEGVFRIIFNENQPTTSPAPYKIYNIGNNQPEQLMSLIQLIENALGKKAILNLLPLQPGDVPKTFANISRLEKDYGFKPTTSLKEGIEKFVAWYRDFYRLE